MSLFFYDIYFSFHAGNGQRCHSHLRHHSAFLSFIRHDLHISCHIFQIQVRTLKMLLLRTAWKKCMCWLLIHILNLWRMHTKKKPNSCKNFKFNCKNLSLIPKYLRKLKIKLLKLSAKMNLKYTSMQISINFCLKYFFIFCLICKNEKQFFLNLYKK